MSKPSTQSSSTMSTEAEAGAKNETSSVPTQGLEEEDNADDDDGLGAGAIVAIVFVVIGLTVGLFLLYKRKRDMNERLPLNNIPSMSSLQSR